ncbi:phospholipase D-like domain-containing protein [Promethearchaeum syntrophicum]|uniref:Phospholipase D-like domain-containing protein n=1 Tax=Promethearchaeum syntrophicum TaxID=2594042 RepID=A0A5B9D625_9ARCH|nr:phospholipase D-like domain-containing protein [Candidatus Prometheoarchaeum syntrophicum]QEE14588.1 cardiolipin synthetase [Candidatus Prometheoarchaeum syntrophicum]
MVKKIPRKKIILLLFALLLLQTFPINSKFLRISPSVNNVLTSEILKAQKTPIKSESSETNASQDVIDYFRQLFQNDWDLGEVYIPVDDETRRTQSYDRAGSGYEPFLKKEIYGTMDITPILSPDNSEAEIIKLINRATTTLKIEQMYFYSALTDIINAIIDAEHRGVDCQVILDDSNDESDATANMLTEELIEVKVSNSLVPVYFDTMHNKGIIVDSEIVLISSINWSPTSLRDNREAGLIIENAEVAAYYEELFDHDWDVCLDYDPDNSFGSIEDKDPSFSQMLTKTEDSKQFPKKSNDFSNPETISGEMALTVMASPDNCFDVVANLLSIAQSTIIISVYTLSQPYLLDIIADRIAHGIDVKLLLEKYQVGPYERSYNRGALYNFTQLGIPSVANPNVNLTAVGKWADTDFYFQHCKYIIIDDEILILSSGNLSRASCPKPQDDGDVDGNRDWWVVVYGSDPQDLIPSGTDSTKKISGYNLGIYFVFTIIGIICISKMLKERYHL